MQIYKQLVEKDKETVKKLIKEYGFNPFNSKKKSSEDNAKELMKHDSYRRINGRMKQRRWG